MPLLLVAREPSEWALEKAKQNVLEHYLLVGVLEELEDVLLLLERLLPHFFFDVLNIYKSPGGSSFPESLTETESRMSQVIKSVFRSPDMIV